LESRGQRQDWEFSKALEACNQYQQLHERIVVLQHRWKATYHQVTTTKNTLNVVMERYEECRQCLIVTRKAMGQVTEEPINSNRVEQLQVSIILICKHFIGR
jgi:ethanolamine utilization protein EutA (predicted chaperonin)